MRVTTYELQYMAAKAFEGPIVAIWTNLAERGAGLYKRIHCYITPGIMQVMSAHLLTVWVSFTLYAALKRSRIYTAWTAWLMGRCHAPLPASITDYILVRIHIGTLFVSLQVAP